MAIETSGGHSVWIKNFINYLDETPNHLRTIYNMNPFHSLKRLHMFLYVKYGFEILQNENFTLYPWYYKFTDGTVGPTQHSNWEDAVIDAIDYYHRNKR